MLAKLKRPLQDGSSELRFGQVEFLQKLAILIPPPHKNLTSDFDVFAPAHRFRADVVAMGESLRLGIDTHDNHTTGPPVDLSAA